MARKGYCKICNDKALAQINSRIRSGESNASIVRTYGMHPSTLKKHRENCISKLLSEDKKAKELMIGDSLVKQVEEKIAFIDKLVLGCDEYLTDPEDSSKYFLGNRGDDIEVVYRQRDPESKTISPIQKKCNLQSMMDAIADDGNYIIMNMTSKHSDPRDLLLKGIGELRQVVKMLVDTTQHVMENEQKNAAIAKASKEGGIISFQKSIEKITEQVTIAMKGSNTEELSSLAGLPDLEVL